MPWIRILEGKSDIIPVEIKKNGEISTARSKVASTEEFAVITRYVEHEIRQCGEAIYAGNIAVNPYRSDIETSCTYCPYGSVCGMDAKIPGYEYRQFASMKKKKNCLTRCRQSLPEQREGAVLCGNKNEKTPNLWQNVVK